MEHSAHLTEQYIRGCIPLKSKIDEKPVLESVGFNVHLIGADLPADADVVVPANHVERLRDRKDVGAALERSEPAVAEPPIVAHEGGRHAATHAVAG